MEVTISSTCIYCKIAIEQRMGKFELGGDSIELPLPIIRYEDQRVVIVECKLSKDHRHPFKVTAGYIGGKRENGDRMSKDLVKSYERSKYHEGLIAISKEHKPEFEEEELTFIKRLVSLLGYDLLHYSFLYYPASSKHAVCSFIINKELDPYYAP